MSSVMRAPVQLPSAGPAQRLGEVRDGLVGVLGLAAGLGHRKAIFLKRGCADVQLLAGVIDLVREGHRLLGLTGRRRQRRDPGGPRKAQAAQRLKGRTEDPQRPEIVAVSPFDPTPFIQAATAANITLDVVQDDDGQLVLAPFMAPQDVEASPPNDLFAALNQLRQGELKVLRRRLQDDRRSALQ